jgi:hypothetical protein
MKSTKIMLGVIFTAFCTWMFLASLVWMFSDLTFKQSATSYGVIVIMMICGWIPPIAVGADLEDHLD